MTQTTAMSANNTTTSTNSSNRSRNLNFVPNHHHPTLPPSSSQPNVTQSLQTSNPPFVLQCDAENGPTPSFMPKSLQNIAVQAKVYVSGQHRRVPFAVESDWSCQTFFQNLRTRCQFNQTGALTVKWLDDEDDPCTISSQLELDEAIRYIHVNKLNYIKLHVFNGSPEIPGQRPPGETKAMYRKNARRLAKFKRLFKPKRNERPSIVGQPMNNGYQNEMYSSQKFGNNTNINTSRNSDNSSSNQQFSSGQFGLSHFELVKVIGRGSYAKVLLCRLKTSKQLYAMKVIKKETISDEEDVDWVNTEKKVFEQATNHPFLVGMHSCFQTVSRLFFVIEYVNGGDLMFHMQRQRKLPEDHARFYSAEIILALDFLHSRYIVYRDLKLDNVLLDSQGHIKLTDYGMCKEGMHGENALTSTFCGTPNYIAPEILRGSPYGFSVDWWALGVLMYEMMAGKSPFDINDAHAATAENSEELLFQVILERPIRMPRSLSIPASKVLKRFLDKDPDTRLGCSGLADIQSDSFFRTLDWGKLSKKQVIPPFRPTISDEMGLDNFDTQFTTEVPRLTPDDPEAIAKINQADFEDFNFNNPLLLTAGQSV
jgi:atypical protein kinase C iota type